MRRFAAVIVILGGLALIGALVWNGTSDRRAVVAPEIAALPPSITPVPIATASVLCPPAPAWESVVANPSAYRGRCVYVVGTVGPKRDAAGETFRLDLPGADAATRLTTKQLAAILAGSEGLNANVPAVPANQPPGSVWIALGQGGEAARFWDKADTQGVVGVLGTITGTQDGLVVVRTADIYYTRPV